MVDVSLLDASLSNHAHTQLLTLPAPSFIYRGQKNHGSRLDRFNARPERLVECTKSAPHFLLNAGVGTTALKETTYSDPSGAIFSMYISRASTFDDENVENWKGGAEGILVFTGLFSSTVATFIAISYPNLQQDPNVTTHSLLAQIASQQLSNATTNGTSSAASPSTQSSFSPSASVVFINSVWFLSLVLSLTCALMATLLQQWARRYLQIIQRNHAPHVRAHIREYFSRGARKFRISGLVEALPILLLLSVLLFFAGLVVFAFLANHIVAYITLATVAFFVLSYIALTLMALIFHDCPYQTPLSSLLWSFAQMISFTFFSAVYHSSKQLHKRWGLVGKDTVKSFKGWQKKKAKSFADGRISKLEHSAKYISMAIYRRALVWTLRWLDQDHELEEFVTGIPGLYESEAFATHDNGDAQRAIRPVLAVLPGPTSSHATLPWSIMRLAQRAIVSNLSEPIQRQRVKACLKGLYYIPGAIRDVLAPYAAGKHYCLEILPLLNSPESLEIIEELWDTPNDDVALSVRCAAAVVAAFMITPPRRTLDKFVTGNVQYIWENDAGRHFLSERLGTDGALPDLDSRRDSARLQNLVRFLGDVKNTLGYMDTGWWTSDNELSIRKERRALFEARRTPEYRTGRGTFDQQGDRASPAFVPAAQQDLITLTLEILARDPVANAGKSQRDAFYSTCKELVLVASEQARSQGLAGVRAQENVQPRLRSLRPWRARRPVPAGLGLEPLVRTQAQVADSFETVRRALEPVLQSLRLQIRMPVPQIESAAAPAAIVITTTEDSPRSAHAGSAHGGPGPSPPPVETAPFILQYSGSTSTSPGGLESAARELGYSIWSDAPGNA